jgi:glycosyltransferase involved in cell wall biosynthesis
MQKNVFIIVPALAPERETLDPLVDSLLQDFGHVILVDDGSSEEYRPVFEDQAKKGAVVLRHYINMGKGRAMKDAVNYILSNYDEIDSIVTADSDGQHSAEDIARCARASMEHPDAYVLGARDFGDASVPFKSRYGNVITRNVFRLFVGLTLTDTQTGLRAMSKGVAVKLLASKGERYEYETNTLIDCKQQDIPIVEVKIATIYRNENKGSHFHPFRDGLSIYKLFFKYIFASGSSFVVDILLFSLFLGFFNGMANKAFTATVCARILSSLYNFAVNSKLVFRKMNRASLIKYFILVVIQMLVSAFAVNELLNWLGGNAVLLKILVDVIIFFVNFVIQREFIFKN